MLKKIHGVAICVICSSLATFSTNTLAAEKGLASYYADRFQGRKTASGDRYDRNKLTAAHRTLPIGSKVEVTNLKTNDSVIVTINDRGPYIGNRKLDLSYAAAKELGLLQQGVATVSYEVISPEKNSDFEKVIPLEYAPGVLEVAKSEEEMIEAEEELVISDSVEDAKASDVAKTETIATTHHSHHKHKAKKTASSDNQHTVHSKKHAVKSNKHSLKHSHKNKS